MRRPSGPRWLGERVEQARRLAQQAQLAKSDRADPVWLGLGLASLITVVLGIALVALLWPDPKADVTLVKDRRILDSVTASGACFQGLTVSPDATVVTALSQDPSCKSAATSGGVVSYDPVWDIWGDQVMPFASDVGKTMPASLRRVGDSLWVGGDLGGLATSKNGQAWRPWLSQTAFGGGSASLTATTIVAVANSPDRKFSAMLSRAGEAFVYDTATATWTSAFRVRDARNVVALTWDANGIWVAQRDGLFWSPRMAGSAPRFAEPKRVSNDVALRLAPDGDRGLLALVDHRCPAPMLESCRSLLRFEVAAGQITRTILIDGTTAMSGARPQDMRFVAVLGDRIFFGGTSGLWAYHAAKRRWDLMGPQAVTAMEVVADDGHLAFGGRGWIARLAASDTKALVLSLPDSAETVTTILQNGSERPIYVTDTSSLHAIAPDGSHVTLFQVTAPTKPAATRLAVGLSDSVILSTDDSVWRRSDADRTYRKIAGPAVADILNRASIVETADQLVVAQDTESGETVLIGPDKSAPPVTGQLPELTSVSLETGLGRALATTADERLAYLSTNQGLTLSDALANQPRSGPSDEDIRDIATAGETLVMGYEGGVLAYSAADRGWTVVSTDPTLSLATDPQTGALYRISAAGDLWRSSLPPKTGQTPEVAMIAGGDFKFSAAQVLDVRAIDANRLAILGQGDTGDLLIHVYDGKQRRVAQTLNLGRAKDRAKARILDFPATAEYLVQVENRLLTPKGALPLAEGSTGVLTGWPSRDGTIAVETDAATGQPFLHEFAAGTQTCRFRGTTVAASSVKASYPIDTEASLVETRNGFVLHDKRQNRWFKVNLPNGAYSFATGFGALWFRKDRAGQDLLLSVSRAQIPLAASCASETAKVEPVEHPGAVIDPVTGAMISRLDGMAVQLQPPSGNGVQTIRPAAGKAPSGALLRGLRDGQMLWLAAEDALYRYDLKLRQWARAFAWQPGQPVANARLFLGTGRLDGTVVATFQDKARWSRATMRKTGQGNAALSSASIKPPLKIPQASRSPLLAVWSMGPANADVFHFEGRLVFVDRDSLEVIGSWAAPDGQGRGLMVGQRFVFVQQDSGTVLSARMDGQAGLGRAPAVYVLPSSANPGFDANADPAFQTPDGQIYRCQNGNPCASVSPPWEQADSAAFSGMRRFQSYWLRPGTDGLIEVIQRRNDGGLALVATGVLGLPSQAQADDGILGLGSSSDGTHLILRNPDGSIAASPLSSPTTDQDNMQAKVQDGTFLRASTDDAVAVLPDGRIVDADFDTHRPVDPQPWIAAKAIGQLGDGFWHQDENQLTLAQLGCSIDPPVNVTESGVSTECSQEWVTGSPPGTLTWLRISQNQIFAAALDGRLFVADLADDKPTGDWTKVDDPIPGTPTTFDDFARDALFAVPSGGYALTKPLVLDITAGSTAFGAMDLSGPGPLKADRGDELPSLTGSWVKADNAARVFSWDGPAGRVDLPFADAWDGSSFKPSQLSWPNPQEDGTVLAVTPFGILRFDSNPALHTERAQLVLTTPLASEPVAGGKDGYWLQDRFVPIDGGAPIQSPVSSETYGVLTITQDSRGGGVALEVAGEPARDATGMLWDKVQAVGFSEQDEPLAIGPLGGMRPDDPLSQAPDKAPMWLVSTDLAGLLAMQPQPQDHLAAEEMIADQAGLRLSSESLISADGQRGQAVLALGDRLEITDGGLTGANNAPLRATRVSTLPDGQGVLLSVADALYRVQNQSVSPISVDTAQALLSQLARLGPLNIARGRNGKLALWLAAGTENIPVTLKGGRFSFDALREVRLTQDGDLVVLSDAAVMLSPGGVPDLNQAQVLAAAEPASHLRSGTSSGDVVVISDDPAMRSCSGLLAGTVLKCPLKGAAVEQRRATADTGITLMAEHDGAWRFSLLHPQIGPSATSLREGRLSMDRLAMARACDGRFYYLDTDGRLWAAPGDRPLQQSQPILADMALQTMQCQGTGDSLVVERTDETWAAITAEPDGQVSLTDLSTDEAATQARKFAVPARRQDRIARLSAEASLAVTTKGVVQESILTISGVVQALMPVDGLGPAQQIDLPRGFFVLAGAVWAITDQGVLPFGKFADSRLFPRPADRPVTPAASDCFALASRSLDDDTAEVSCADGNGWRLVDNGGSLAATPVEKGFPLVQTANTPVLTFTTDRVQGLVDARFGKEYLDMKDFAGQFPFDRVSDIVVSSRQSLHLAGDLGWWSMPPGQTGLVSDAVQARLALMVGLRALNPGLVTARNLNLRPGSVALCTSDADGRASVDVTEGEAGQIAAALTDGCPDLLASDALRNFWDMGDGAVVYSTRSLPKWDKLIKGRFASDTLGPGPDLLAANGVGDEDIYCFPSALAEVWIKGNDQSSFGRVAQSDCGQSAARDENIADGKAFTLMRGHLGYLRVTQP